MILTEFKPIEEILERLKEEKVVFIMGCGGCPEGANTGGMEVLNDMKTKLEENGIKVSGVIEIDFLCQKALIRSRLKPRKQEIEAADSVLVFSCGLGVQASSAVIDKVCHPALNTITFGGITGMWQGTERCDTCGNCILDLTGGICPYTACPKKLENGPCAGQGNDMCETDPQRDCGWVLIYKSLKRLGQLDRLMQFIPPRDYRKILPSSELRKTRLWALDEEEAE
ncbi:MAG: methylenetetrahydrofolate reductase C-terminal domain-containing protein [Actinobacteria bacterium]|nr:methylenetetrahydrofolate reductase C-terminal domain-containing protein [Actinomycetota bacterium]